MSEHVYWFTWKELYFVEDIEPATEVWDSSRRRGLQRLSQESRSESEVHNRNGESSAQSVDGL